MLILIYQPYYVHSFWISPLHVFRWCILCFIRSNLGPFEAQPCLRGTFRRSEKIQTWHGTTLPETNISSYPLKIRVPWKSGDSELGNHHFQGSSCNTLLFPQHRKTSYDKKKPSYNKKKLPTTPER